MASFFLCNKFGIVVKSFILRNIKDVFFSDKRCDASVLYSLK